MNSRYVVSCQQCGLNALCIPHSLSEEEMDELDSKLKRGRPLQRGQYVFEEGRQFGAIFAVRSGAVKSFSIDDNGDEQVIGFFLPGEILGLDAIEAGQYVSTARALETTAICEIPYEQVENLSSKIPTLQSHMYRLLSREIREDQELQMLLGKKTAEERIGSFLINLSRRYELRRLSPITFRLPMSRTDIGNYLGLAVETVSRVFTKLQNSGLLHVEGKEIEILDQTQLHEIAHHDCPILMKG